MITKEKLEVTEIKLQEKISELETARGIIDKYTQETEKVKKDDKKQNYTTLRSSHLFHINTSTDKVPKCTDDCVIY